MINIVFYRTISLFLAVLITSTLVSCGSSKKNKAPSVKPLEKVTTENKSIQITLDGTDTDGDLLTYHIVNKPVNGTLSNITAENKVTYTPKTDFHNTDVFSYQATDGKSESNTATVIINVKEINITPIAVDKKDISMLSNTSIPIKLIATDENGDTMKYEIVSKPSNGKVTVSGNESIYIPNKDYIGSDSFTFKVFDGTNYSNTAIISITIIAVNKPPVAKPASSTTSINVPLTLKLIANDPDKNKLTYTIVSQPTYGKVTLLDDEVTYIPNKDVTGIDSFRFQASDGSESSNIATVSITVIAVNKPPVAKSASSTTSRNVPLTLKLIANDPDKNKLTYTIISHPIHGKVTLLDDKATYIPNKDVTGIDSFRFQASDGSETSNIATVSITVIAVNKPPVAKSASTSTSKNAPLTLKLIASDPDNNKLTYTIVSHPIHGKVTLLGDKVTYTPNKDVTGTDSFRFQASDGSESSNIATVSITVIAANKPPVAKSASTSTSKNVPLTLKLTASDPDKNKLTFTIVSHPTHGKVTLQGDKATYTPNKKATGKDSFRFRASDGKEDSNIATVSILIANSGEKVQINLDSATQISRTQLTGDMRTILLTEKHIFFAAGEAGLHTLSRNNNNPSIISTLAINDYALSIQLSSDNETLFIAADTGGLAIVDVTTPSKGKLLASIETNYIAEDIAVSDDNKYVYIADGEAGITVVDISNLYKPILRGNISIPNHGYAHGIKLSRDNKHVFVASTFGGLNIFDVSDPDSPLFVSQIDTGDKAYSLVLSQDENTAFVASGKAGIAVINITNKKLPSRIGSWNDTPPIVDEFYPINAMDLKLLSDQTTILVATGAAGIYRVNVTKKNLPVTMDFVDTPDRATRFVLSEDESKLFVSSGVFSLLIYDVSIRY